MPARRTFVVVGASLAGGTAAAVLREQGFDGRLVLIGDEPLPPYERPALSKGYLRGETALDELFVRGADWWEAHGVEARLGERVQLLDPVARTVVLDDGQRIAFDAALLATGVRNRTLEVPGAGLGGIYSLRTVADADRLHAAAATASKAVVVGMGFVGAEVASSLRAMGLEVTVVELFETALYRVLGGQLGRVVEAIHRDRGIELLFDATVARFEGAGRVERVLTRDGRAIDADLVVVGVGTQPNSEVMRGHGIAANGGIEVDAALRTGFPGVFAAGDVAAHDHPIFGPIFGRIRVEHFDNAVRMGEHAARAMLGAAEPFDDPHWFWSDQFEHQIQMAGVAVAGRMVVRGSLEERRFCAFFLDETGVLRAAVSVDWARDVRRSRALIQQQVAPDPAALADPGMDLRTLVSEPAG